MGRTLVIGVGNPILSDDGVGLEVARKIKALLPGIDFCEEENLGLNLLDSVIGYEQVLIIDSIKIKDAEPGTLFKLSVDDLKSSLHLSSPHTVNLPTSIEIGKRLGLNLPKITIYAIQIEDNQTFCENLTPKVRRRVGEIVGEILEDLKNKKKI
ncbi:hydrogenase maturation protease [bacterium]|nr:hydrogenase maturation protease [bacterium]MBU1615402.1 hydrogenase maturation protease [bacterium]